MEGAVSAAMSASGIEAYLPVYTTETRWTDRTKTTTRPLFPGYIFLHYDPSAFEVRRVRGVVGLLGARNDFYVVPEVIPDAQIESVRRVCNSLLAVEPCAYVAGETVKIESGPLAGIEGVIVRTKGGTRVVVSLEILHRAVSVELDSADLAKAA